MLHINTVHVQRETLWVSSWLGNSITVYLLSQLKLTNPNPIKQHLFNNFNKYDNLHLPIDCLCMFVSTAPWPSFPPCFSVPIFGCSCSCSDCVRLIQAFLADSLLISLLKSVLFSYSYDSSLVNRDITPVRTYNDDSGWGSIVVPAAGWSAFGEVCGGIPRALQQGQLARCCTWCLFSAGAGWNHDPLRSPHVWFSLDRAD